MNYFQLIEKYATGKGEKAMWAAVRKMSEFLDEVKEAHPEKYWQVVKDTYEELAGPHYNEDFAVWQIAQLFYKDSMGAEHRSPNWTAEQYRRAFEEVKSRVPSGYTMWDFAVTLEKQYTDYHAMMKRWFPSATEEELKAKAVDAAVAFLADDDDKKDGKIWRYYNGG